MDMEPIVRKPFRPPSKQTEPDDEDFYIKLGMRLEQARISTGLSRQKFANAMGVSKQLIYRCEREGMRTTIHTVMKWARLTNTTVNELIGEVSDGDT